MDAPFHPAIDSPSHKGGGSIIFLTTDLERIRRRIAQQEDSPTDTIATGTTGSSGSHSKTDRPGAIGQTYWIGL